MIKSKLVISFAAFLLAAFMPRGNAQVFSTYNPNEEIFQYEVKVIDEFIERFNDNKDSYLRKTYATAGKPYNITRTQLLVSLFNMGNTSFTDKDTALRSFFHQVLDKQHPAYLSFTDSDWYAEAASIFLYNGKLVEIPIILHIKSNGDEWAKWMIAGTGNNTVSHDPKPSVSLKNDVAHPALYISTSAYATNFVELHYVFSRTMEPEYYFDLQFIKSIRGKEFIDRVKKGALTFQYVKNITFHFYQIPGWVFTVEQFRRKTYNNGWLINGLQQMNETEKESAKNKLLYR